MNRRIDGAQSPASSRATLRLAHSVACMVLYTSACNSPAHSNPTPPQATNLRSGAEVPIWGGERLFHLGERAEAPDYVMTISDVKECAVEPYFQTIPGKARLGVEVSIEGTASAEVPVNPFYASLVSESGDSFEISLAGCKPSLAAVRVTKGKQVSGWITFEVPRSLAGLKMIYRPTIIGKGAEELRFDLGNGPGG